MSETLAEFIQDHTSPLPIVSEAGFRVRDCKRCDIRFRGPGEHCPDCVAQGAPKPQKRNISPEGQARIAEAARLRHERERAEKGKAPKPVLQLVHTPSPEPQPMPLAKPAPTEDAYAIVAALARTHTLAHLRAALALKEMLEVQS